MARMEKTLKVALERALMRARKERYEYISCELWLRELLRDETVAKAFDKAGLNVARAAELLDTICDTMPRTEKDRPKASYQFTVVESALATTEFSVVNFVAEVAKLSHSKSAAIIREVDVEAFSMYYREKTSTPGEKKHATKPEETIGDYLRLVKPAKIIGRQKEMERLTTILSRKNKRNAVLVGNAGVGKTAIAEGFAEYLLATAEVPESIEGKAIYSLCIAEMLAGAKYRGDFEERLTKTIRQVESRDDVIIFIDEIHTIMGAGNTDGAIDASQILKPAMARGNIQIIGATTFEEYKRLEKDSAFNRRVQKIICEEPSEAETVEILKGVKSSYEKHHNVSYSDEVISSIVSSATRYINDRFNPDRSFDVLDEAGATAARTGDKVVTEAHIEKAISAMTSVKKVVVETAETKPMLSKGLDEELAKTVYGQDEVIRAIQKAYRLYDSGLTDDDKPIASMLWVGPTGVGKTQLAESLAKATGAELIKLDMSEYQEKHAVAKLTGAPAGYVGYEDGSILVDAVRKHPNAVILFDEIEKAHPDVYNVLLQIMDKAQLTDNQGRKADFKNAAILMTSNCGVAEATAISKKPTLGFGTSSTVTSTMDKTIMDAVEKKFPPEFRNRLTQTVLFNQVDESMGKRIIDREMKKLNAKLVSKKLNITLEDTAIDEILKKGISIEFGAREIKRIIDKNIKELAVQLIIDEGRSGSINVGCIDGNFCVVE